MVSVPQPPLVNTPRLVARSGEVSREPVISLANTLLAAAVLSSLLQLLWFWPKAIHQIDIDAMDYTGIALELKQTLFHSAINGFRSPLISWLIALIPHLDVFTSGKLITISSYLVSIVLLYVFTKRLWNSKLAAATAFFLFTLARGLAFYAIALISPDFLFMALTLSYFIVLLECVRRDRYWFVLGGIHAMAFLAKGFALPWLAVVTFTTIFFCTGKRLRLRRISAAIALPLIVASLWAAVLHSKYGVFVTGTQFKTNLLQWTLHEYRNHPSARYSVLSDITEYNDSHMVNDPMPPGTWPWHYQVHLHQLLPAILKAEITNVPRMIKELIIQANPGVIAAFVLLLFGLPRRGRPPLTDQQWMVLLVAVATAALVLAYSMLVVDARYLFPLTPLLIAIGARFLVAERALAKSNLARACCLLVVSGAIWSLTYASSPFRVQSRDFQVVCYETGSSLRQHDSKTVVGIGSGPFPEHGVGWEASYKSAYFAQTRLIATAERLPGQGASRQIVSDVAKASPDAVLVWAPNDDARRNLASALNTQHYSEKAPIIDPVLGDVGVVLFRR